MIMMTIVFNYILSLEWLFAEQVVLSDILQKLQKIVFSDSLLKSCPKRQSENKKTIWSGFFYSDFTKLKSWKNKKYWILGTKNLSKPIQLYTNRFGFPMRIFCRKPIEKTFCSSKDILEKLKLFVSKGSHIESFWNLMFKLVSNKNY